MNVFATVKTSINTREAAARYGVEVNHHGKALCPFHNDRHPSLFVDDDHYHCYACGEHGDVIDFTSKLYGLSMLDAAKKLAYDFGITQDKPPTKATLEKLNKKSEAQRLKENEKLCFSALLEYMKLLREWMVLYAPRTPEDTPHDCFVQACHHLSYVEYLVDLLIMGDSYERTEVIDDDRRQAEKAANVSEKSDEGGNRNWRTRTLMVWNSPLGMTARRLTRLLSALHFCVSTQ